MWPINSNGRGRAFACVYRVFLDAGWQGARGNRCYGRSLISLGGQWLSTRASFSIFFFPKALFTKFEGGGKRKRWNNWYWNRKNWKQFYLPYWWNWNWNETEFQNLLLHKTRNIRFQFLKFCGIVELCSVLEIFWGYKRIDGRCYWNSMLREIARKIWKKLVGKKCLWTF